MVVTINHYHASDNRNKAMAAESKATPEKNSRAKVIKSHTICRSYIKQRKIHAIQSLVEE